MQSHDQRSCPVCGDTISGKFCHNCGVQYQGRRMTAAVFVSDLIESFFGVHQSVWFNIRHLIKHPDKVVKSYWNGYRRAYYSPGRMLLIASLMLALNFFFNENSFLGLTVKSENISVNIGFILFSFPLFVLFTMITYFRKRKNIFEHIVLNAYVFGLVISVFVLLSWLENLVNKGSLILLTMLFIIYFIWVARIFESKRYKIILMTMLNALVFVAFLGIVYLFIDFPKE